MGNNTWLVVERLENWEADRDAGFTLFGISQYVVKRAQNICLGDRLVVYVSSGVSCFADIRRITSSEIDRLGFVEYYDNIFPYCIRTESVLALDRPSWVPIKGMIRELSFTKEKRDWRQVMRNAFRLMSVRDAKLIVGNMERSVHGK